MRIEPAQFLPAQALQFRAGFAVVSNTTLIQITDPTNAELRGLLFDAGEEQIIEVQMQLNPGATPPGGTTFNWDVMHLAPLTTNAEPSIIGGERYRFIVPGRDADGDGLPDDWETAHGLNPNDPSDAGGDLDGDGVTNLQEYLAGTAPTDPLSTLRLEVLRYDGAGNFVVRLQTSPYRSYAVEAASSLGSEWTTVESVPAQPVRTVEVTVPSNGQATRFVRVRVE